MIYYAPNARSLVKACLLARIHQTTCQPKEAKAASCLFSQPELDADDFNLEELACRYTELTGRNLDWLFEPRVSRLYSRVSYALRHSSPARYSLSEQALEDALEYGLEYFLSCVSTPCRKFTNLAREVAHEVQRMLGFIRFVSPAENVLVARPKLFYNTADLILRKFQPRYPNYMIILLLTEGALCLEKGNLTKLEPQECQEYLQSEDQYTAIWENYYKSQYIESRKNIPLVSKAIPQKYWDWMSEGGILQEEKDRK